MISYYLLKVLHRSELLPEVDVEEDEKEELIEMDEDEWGDDGNWNDDDPEDEEWHDKEEEIDWDDEEYEDSHWYSVIASSGEYEIIKEIVRNPVANKYTHNLNVYCKGKLKHSIDLSKYMKMDKISGINFIKTEKVWLAFAAKNQLRVKYNTKDYILFRSGYVLQITDITKLYDELSNAPKDSAFTDISDLVLEINVIDEIKKILSNSFSPSYRIRSEDIEYCFDIKLGLIYIMLPVYTTDQEYSVVIFRKKVGGSLNSLRQSNFLLHLKPDGSSIYKIQNRASLDMRFEN
jgi:hypothetical protein